jgi:hypothetical protein
MKNISVADQLALSVHHCCHSTTNMLMHSYVHPQMALNYRGYISITTALNKHAQLLPFVKKLFDKKHFHVFSLLLSVAEVPVTAGVDGSVSLTTLNEGVKTFQATTKSRLHFFNAFFRSSHRASL